VHQWPVATPNYNVEEMIQSLRRGLQILEYLAGDGGQATVKDTARFLGVDPSTASRLMATLETQGFLQQDPKTQAYQLGTRILELNNALLRTYGLGAHSHDIVQALARDTEEGSHLAVLVAGEAVFVDRGIGKGLITVNTEIGARDPIYCTAIGRALLFGMTDEEVREELKEIRFKRFTTKTVSSMRELLAKLATVRAMGFAFDDEEFHEGVQCVAAPVFDHGGRTVAAIGMSGPKASVEKATIPKLARRVVAASNALSAQLGHSRVLPAVAVVSGSRG
jgi:IclR family acetate operon transcriptional repressor